ACRGRRLLGGPQRRPPRRARGRASVLRLDHGLVLPRADRGLRPARSALRGRRARGRPGASRAGNRPGGCAHHPPDAEGRVAAARRLPPRSLVLTQARYRHGSNLDPETQITIGAQNGLRGYAVNQWTGTRSLLLATEARFFVADEVKQLLSFAVAAFAETGYAWPQPVRVALHDLRSDVGLGLLIGRNRFTTRPLRIDV